MLDDAACPSQLPKEMSAMKADCDLERLFHEASQQDASEWESFVRDLPGDSGRQLLQMLKADQQLHDTDDTFLDSSGTDPAATNTANMPNSMKSTYVGHSVESTHEHPEQIGDYRILNVIAIHGQGVVYRADHVHLNRQVVIKVSKDRLDEHARKALIDEGRSLASLSHPNIAQIYDLKIEDDFPCLVMEYIEGQNLADRQGRAPMQPADAVELARQLCAGMQHAHSRGIIHRDLKPANVVMRAADNTPMIIDFGLARVRSAFSTEVEHTSYGGTIAYMAPEQARHLQTRMQGGETVDPTNERSDVFALGAILYTMLTGKKPYSFKGNCDGLQKAVACEFDRQPLSDNGIPVWLRNACLKAMAKSPDERFATTDEFANALRPPKQISLPLIATAAAVLLAVAAWRLWPAATAKSGVSDSVANASGEVTLPAPAELQPLQYTHYANADQDSRTMGPLFENGNVRENDDLRLDGTFPNPVYCFLIALNPDGTVQLCYPDARDAAQEEPIAEIHFPSSSGQGFGFTDGAGQQGFLLVTSPNPLPTFDSWVGSVGKLQDALVEVEGRWYWNDGQVVPVARQTRGAIRDLQGHEDFSALCERIQSSSNDQSVHGVTFAVEPR
jgi:tRNA A-37 threonylcarbamoyl transferase component Bud32